MELVGYADKLSVAPGERVRFMVNSEAPTYEAVVVRLVHADQAANGPGFKEEVVDTPAAGHYRGRRQSIHAGSYVWVADSPHLNLRSLTLQAWIYPTTPRQDDAQGLLAKWSVSDGVGYGLFIEKDGDLACWIGDEYGNSEKFCSGRPLRGSQWYFVACTYDADQRRACLYQEPLSHWPLDESSIVVERTIDIPGPGASAGPLLIAGGYCLAASTKGPIGALYNGKIDSPRIFSRALQASEIASLASDTSPKDVGGEALVAAWDFAIDISLATVTDTAPHELHGEAINMPSRAMTGHNWTGREVNVNNASEQYGAIHFHHDDLTDAGWDVDFELHVPERLRSGVYAARLTSGDNQEYIPFYVTPKRGTPSARVAFLAPTMTYVAYANDRRFLKHKHAGRPITLAPQDLYLVEHPELGLSLYDVHADGSGCCYSSRLRPILSMRPHHRDWWTGATRHFAADLYLVDWLEKKGYQHDILTDGDLHAEGTDLLAPYRVVITGTHPEYWTTPMMTALERYLESGGRLMYLGGNGFYWVASVDPHHPHIIEVRRGVAGTSSWKSAPGESYHSTTCEVGGLWRYRGRAPQKLVGVGFTAEGRAGAAGYCRQSGSFNERAAFIFEGIGADEVIGDFGLVMNGASGDEIDRMDYTLGTPPHTLLLASSTGHTGSYQLASEDIEGIVPDTGGTQNSNVRSDMTFFETPHGGAVFSVGSINWCSSLSHNNYDNNVSRITENVLKRFLIMTTV